MLRRPLQNQPSPTQILAVDDSHVIVKSVALTLENANFEVWQATSGKEALQLLEKRGLPHLALIDLHMPKMDGLALCKRIHKFCDLPIIILTSDDDESTVVTLLDRYAEDYIVKPFRSAELVARIGRVLRRMGDFAYVLKPQIVVDDDFLVDLPHRRIVIRQVEKSLTPIEAKLLYILLKNMGHTVRTEYLIQRIWPTEEAYEDRLHAHIYRLRKKIEVNLKSPRYIMSDWGVGYHFAVMVNSAENADLLPC